jgi:hypothetical protein
VDNTLIIPGKIANQVFVPDSPMPDVEGRAQLIVYALPASGGQEQQRSVFDLIGKASRPRSAEDLDAQLAEERAAWNEP